MSAANAALFTGNRSEGDRIQKPSVVSSLPELMSLDYAACISRIVPMLHRALQVPDIPLHTETAAVFMTLFERDSVSHEDFVTVFLPYVISYLKNNEAGVYNKWLEVAVYLARNLTEADVQRILHDLAVKHAQPEAKVYQKAGAAKILGAMVPHMDTHTVVREAWPLLQSLSQDESSEVRASVCMELPAVFQNTPLDLSKRDLLPCLIEMSRDEDTSVRVAAIMTVLHLIPKVPIDILTSELVPLIRTLSGRAAAGPVLFALTDRTALNVDAGTVVFADQLANFCRALRDREVTAVDLATDMISLFCKLGTYVDKTMGFTRCSADVYLLHEEIRKSCARNLHEMVTIYTHSRGLDRMSSVFTLDPSSNVRAAFAETLHLLIAKSIKKTSAQSLKPLKRVFLDLLRDSNDAVLQGVISHFGESVQLLTSSGIIPKSQGHEVAEAITISAAALNTSNNWRVNAILYSELSCAVTFLTSSYIHDKVHPIVYDTMLNAKPWPIREAAARTIVAYLRYNLTPQQRKAIRDALYGDLCCSASCHRRILFIKVCLTALNLFSVDYFKKFFIRHLLSLHVDRVPNVRLVLARNLCVIYRLTRSDDVIVTLKAMLAVENDHDVIEVLLKAQEEVKSVKNSEGDVNKSEENLKKFNEEKRLMGLSGGEVAKTLWTEPTRNRSTGRLKTVRSTVPSHVLSTSTKTLGSESRTHGGNHLSCTCTATWHRPGVAMEMSWLNLESALRRELDTLIHSNSAHFSSVFEKEFYRDAGVLPDDILYHAPITPKPTTTWQKNLGDDSYSKDVADTNLPSKIKKLSSEFSATRNMFHQNLARTSSHQEGITSRDSPVRTTKVNTLPAMHTNAPKFLAQTRKSKSFVLPTTRLGLSKVTDPTFRLVVAKASELATPKLAATSVTKDSSSLKTTRIPVSNRRSMDVSHWSKPVEAGFRSENIHSGSRLPVRSKKT